LWAAIKNKSDEVEIHHDGRKSGNEIPSVESIKENTGYGSAAPTTTKM